MTEWCNGTKKDGTRCGKKAKHFDSVNGGFKCGYHLPTICKLRIGMLEVKNSLKSMSNKELIDLLKPAHPHYLFWDAYERDAWGELEKRLEGAES